MSEHFVRMCVEIPLSLYANLDKITNGSAASGRILDAVKKHQERPVGHWVSKCEKYYDGVICSVCGKQLSHSDEYRYITDYCPECGARMEDEGKKERDSYWDETMEWHDRLEGGRK